MNTVPNTIHPQLSWLACLYALHCKARREGYLAIAMDVHQPEHESSLFRQFPHVMRQPYLDFATDIFSLIVGGLHDPEELQVYAEQAIASQTRWRWFRRADEGLLRLIWRMQWSFIKGNAPSIASEFGRQHLLNCIKPTRDELYDWLREVDRELWPPQCTLDGGIDVMVDRFMASIEGK